jgi:hypothetical protein
LQNATIGVDTVSLAWGSAEAVDAFLRLDGLVVNGDDERPLRVVPGAGRSVRLDRRLAGLGTVGAFPGASLLYVEGRLAAMDSADEDNHELGSISRALEVTERTVDRLGELLGRALHTETAVRRTDLSGELTFEHNGRDGRALLRALDSMHSPHHKTAPVRERGGPGVETAYWRTPKRSVPALRAYDKGIECGSHGRGERVRLERQLRFAGSKRPSVQQLVARDLAGEYVKPVRSWLREGVRAVTASEALEGLVDAATLWPRHWTGHHCETFWTARKIERLYGTLGVIKVYGKQAPCWSPWVQAARMRELRDLGLLLVDEPVTVDVDALLEQLCDGWRRA